MSLPHLESVRRERSVYLTTMGRKSGKSHTVELWFALARGVVYLSHEGEATDWMKNLKKRPAVSARIGRVTFQAQARLAKGAERDEGARALYEKYYKPASKEVIDDWFSLSEVIMLEPTAHRIP